MTTKKVLKFIGNELVLFFALAIFVGLTIALAFTAIILLALLGKWIGIGKEIFISVAWFFIFLKVWDTLAWVVDKIHDRIERKKEQLNKEQ